MAIAPMSFIGGSSLTGYLLVIAKKTTTPLVTEAILNFPPPVSDPLNLSFTTLDPVPHTIDFRDSPDGSALGTLLTTFLYDVKNRRVVSERRFYRVGGVGANDPAANQTELSDPYLDGKTIGGVFKEGFRYLIQGEEFNPKSGGGISLLAGYQFSTNEVLSIEINYSADVPSPTNIDDPDYKVITTNTTLDINYRNNEIELLGDSTRLTVTLEVISSMPDGTRFKFSSYGGTQLQTLIQTQTGNLIFFNNADSTSIVLGKNEYLTLVKRGSKFKVLESAPGLNMVGERFAAGYLNHPNTIPEDDRPINGDDIPRLYKWLVTELPSTHKITTTDALLDAFSRPAGKEGLFIVCNDSKRFRMPNTQGWSERGLKDFDSYGTDGSRAYDYPGGTQAEQVGPHFHDDAVQNKDASGSTVNPNFNRGKTKPSRRWVANNGTDSATSSTDINTINNGAYATENIVKNIGVIYLRRT